jgi:hypothetical protein
MEELRLTSILLKKMEIHSKRPFCTIRTFMSCARCVSLIDSFKKPGAQVDVDDYIRRTYGKLILSITEHHLEDLQMVMKHYD